MSAEGPHSDPIRASITVAELKRWEDHGATWRAVEVSDEHAVVELCTCYGEPVDLARSEAPELIAFVRAHPDD
ncbi:MAG TPA: hypothetical protein VMU39_01210 [Solirubrobacteraceae bacterium]|nr:hypothetical protein [Solirubrobacteraceae bacterium]